MIDLMAQGCSIEQVASECAISRSHFSRAFKNATGLAPHDWLRQAKILRAEALLKSGRIPISRVAQECGFSDQSYFTRVFRQIKGMSPRRWQSENGALACAQASGETVDVVLRAVHSPDRPQGCSTPRFH
ncbi:AraC-type DNA-binding protein [Pseudomonas sp. NFACC02]|jgi:AraC-like DNA-binding protein|uniref:helix-turn-helix transcriptional regulator n=1 Tax=Pseudomonas sp. NFACC02 TaxID=1566250 RepID=UPI0008CCE177|nr:AraC family transcriptional regulator [Pseudomonas sp. NFACC02]SEQ00999.1 AraC-type DNA-binding protein [Pseudomonas sp. NFACC02]